MAEKEPLPQKDWPPGVEPISFGDTARLCVGRDGQLYWDGKPVVTRRRFDLSRWQKFGAVLATIAVFAGGLGSCASGVDAGSGFACREWKIGCPKEQGAAHRGAAWAWVGRLPRPAAFRYVIPPGRREDHAGSELIGPTRCGTPDQFTAVRQSERATRRRDRKIAVHGGDSLAMVLPGPPRRER